MKKKNEKCILRKKGKVSFLKQNRWILGGSIKENIILGKEYDEEWMGKCLKTAQIFQDFESGCFQDGLDTILGDTSDTVSGGQKARISLARCFYQMYSII